MDQRTIMSLLRRTSIPATICLIVLVGMLGVFGFMRPIHSAHADSPIITAPTGTINLAADASDTASTTFSPAISQSDSDDQDTTSFDCQSTNGGTVSINNDSGTFNVGLSTVTCTASESDTGDSSSVSFNVFVADTAPTFKNVPGPITADPTSSTGAVVHFSYPSAFESGEPGEAISVSCSPGSGTFFPLGTTTVTCTATDNTDGTNPPSPSQTSFTVTVEESAPVFAAHADITVDSTSAAGANVSYTNPSATETEEPAEAINVSCSPASGSLFPIGTTTVTCTATDPDGLTSQTTFAVNVVESAPTFDNLPPSQTLNVPANSPDDQVAFVFPTVTASEPGEPGGSPAEVINVTCTITSGTRLAGNAAGIAYPESCTAVDTDGLTTTGNFTLTVVDNSPPTLVLPASPIVVNATSPAGAVVTFTVTASEPGEPPITPVCTSASGSTFPINPPGQFTTVNCSATDTDPATATGSFQVHVKGAVEQLNDLCNQFPTLSFGNDDGTFCTQLHTVIAGLQSGQKNQACLELTIITGEVILQNGHILTHAQATAILTALARIQNVIGCRSNASFDQG